MFDKLKKYCNKTIPFSSTELELIDLFFEEKRLKKKEFSLQDNAVCNFIGFIEKGSIRHFHIKDGDEKTCDISLENSWVTDFQSFNNNCKAIMNLQAMETSTIFLIKKENFA